MTPTNDLTDTDPNGNRYPLRLDGRSLALGAVILVWTVGHIGQYFSPTLVIPREIDLAMAVVLGGTLGWHIIDILRGGGGTPR